MRRADSLEKTLMLGGIGSRRRKGWQRMRWLDGIADSMDVSLSELGSWWWTGRPGVLRFIGSQRVGHDWVTELNWTLWKVYHYKLTCRVEVLERFNHLYKVVELEVKWMPYNQNSLSSTFQPELHFQLSCQTASARLDQVYYLPHKPPFHKRNIF